MRKLTKSLNNHAKNTIAGLPKPRTKPIAGLPKPIAGPLNTIAGLLKPRTKPIAGLLNTIAGPLKLRPKQIAVWPS